MKREVHVVGAAIFKDDLVLVALRAANMPLPLLWEFPGGKVEASETPQEALAREIFEELECRVGVGEFVARGEHLVGEVKVVLDVYECELRAGTPHAKEHAEIRWVSRSTLKELEFAPADLPAVEKLAQRA